MLTNPISDNAVKHISSSSSSLLIDRHGDFALYHYHNDSSMTADDNDLITELSWIAAGTFQHIHTHRALSLSAEELFPRMQSLIYGATKKEDSLLYYVRYEPLEKTQKSWSPTDIKYKYINKTIAVNVREDHADPIGTSSATSNEKLLIIRALVEAAHNIYIKYIEDYISNKTELNYFLTNRHQLLYLSIDGVQQQFQDQGLYKWFRSAVMDHIQKRFHYQCAYGISFSPALTHVHQKDGYKIVDKIKCRLFEYPKETGNYPFKGMLDGQDEISVMEKTFTKE